MSKNKVTDVARRTLKNAISHTETHNRIKEEQAMWNKYLKHDKPTGKLEDMRESVKERSVWNGSGWNGSDGCSDNVWVPGGCSLTYKAHMDDYNPKQSTRHARQLQKWEEADSNRWAHGGYKELYPDEFDSDRSRSHSPLSSSDRHKKKKKLKMSTSKERHKTRHKRARLSLTPNDEVNDHELTDSRHTKLKQRGRLKHSERDSTDEIRSVTLLPKHDDQNSGTVHSALKKSKHKKHRRKSKKC